MSAYLENVDTKHRVSLGHSVTGSGYSHRENLLWIQKGNDDRVLLHEWFHFFESVSTPMGFIRNELHLKQVESVISFLSKYPHVVYTPIYEWASQFRKNGNSHPTVPDPIAFDQLITHSIAPWTRCMWLEEALDGIGARTAKVDSEARVPTIVSGIEEMHCPWDSKRIETNISRFEAITVSTGGDDVVPLCPLIQFLPDLVDVPIAGVQLSEAMAQILEGVRTGQIGVLPREYSVLIKLVFRCWHKLGRSIDRETQHCIALTGLALADLALFVPIGSVYGSLRPAGQQWADIHPGHRFLRALEVMIETDGWIKSLAPAEGLHDRICNAIGWTRPRRFLETGSELSGNDSAVAAHRDACRVRLRDYSAFLEPSRWGEVLVKEFIDAHMPMSMDTDTGFVCPVNNDPSDAVVRLRNLCVARFCWLVMKGTRPIQVADLAPAEFPYERHFDPVYASPQTFVDLLNQTHAWSSLARLRPLPKYSVSQ